MKRSAWIESSGYLSVICFFVLLTSLMLSGCQSVSHSVIAATGTTIGVEVSQNQATQTPIGVFGYRRAELAYVPTNKISETKSTTGEEAKQVESHSIGNGARDSANVIMELKHQGIFDFGSDSGIYQRLAVGDIAVAQPGAQAMFLKNNTGQIDENAAKALEAAGKAVKNIPSVNSGLEKRKAAIRELRERCKDNANELGKFNIAAQSQGYVDYGAFISDLKTTEGKVAAVEQSLSMQSVNCD